VNTAEFEETVFPSILLIVALVPSAVLPVVVVNTVTLANL
jgi:hypothetical protein